MPTSEPWKDRGADGPPINPPSGSRSHARRLQRPRKRGYRTPKGVRYAGRPSPLANPFEHRRTPSGQKRFSHALSVKLYRRLLTRRMSIGEMRRLGFSQAEIAALFRLRTRVLAMLPRLRGRDIECWCPTSSRFCHVDVLIELANA